MKVEYISHMGNDDTVASAARVSFDKDASNYTEEQNGRLIKYLAKHEHWSPFFHPQITVRETVPIFVARQRFKHTVGFAYSEVSRRYVDDAPEFYVPSEWRGKPINAKQGSSDEVITKYLDEEGLPEYYKNFLKTCEDFYIGLLTSGVAPEQARMVLPQSMYTSYYTTGSLSAFARAYKLRSEENAQREIQELAISWKNIIEPLFPESWSALTNA